MISTLDNPTTHSHVPNTNDDLSDVVRSAIRAADAYDRPDLAGRLGATLQRLSHPSIDVVVVGEFKQGKSSLINALLNSRTCPIDDDIATAVPTSISWSDERSAVAVTRPADVADDVEPDRTTIPFDRIASFATEAHTDPAVEVLGVEVGIDRPLLRRGLSIVDTPGVGGLGSAHATAALGALSVADSAIFISDASQEYTATEMDFLRQAVAMCPHVVVVMSKIDFYPSWRKILEINRSHLRDAGIDAEILPVSSMLRIEALRRDDDQLDDESGFPALERRLVADVLGRSARRTRDHGRAEVLDVVDQLIGSFRSERAALEDPETRALITRQLEEATQRCEQLRSSASHWSTTLNDGITDLTSDVEHDFRQRIRNVVTDCDAAIENSDPLETWAEFEPWLAARVSHDVVGNYRYLDERIDHLRQTVHEHFAAAGGDALNRVELENGVRALARVTKSASMELEGAGAGAKGMTVLRSSYSGILMFTMLGSMVGVALGPIAIGIGLAMGRKGLRDEKERQLEQRRMQAKGTVRTYTDEVSFQVGKDSRDTLRVAQRTIRDFYTSRAEELHTSTSEALAAAREAARRDDHERDVRLYDVDAELERLAALRGRIVEVTDEEVGR